MLKHATWITNARTRMIAANVAGGDIDKDRETPGEDSDFPYAIIAIGNDTAKPDGDPRTGVVDFVHETVLAVQVVDAANTGTELKAKLAAESEKVMAALCPGILDWAVNAEGIDSVHIIYEMPPEGADIVGRVMIAFTLLSRSHWPLPDADAAALPNLTTVSINAGNGVVANVPVPTV